MKLLFAYEEHKSHMNSQTVGQEKTIDGFIGLSGTQPASAGTTTKFQHTGKANGWVCIRKNIGVTVLLAR